VPKLKALAKASIDTAIKDNLSASFDGQPVPFFRSTAPTFDYTLPKKAAHRGVPPDDRLSRRTCPTLGRRHR
jgi:hypothetical protein